MKAFGNAVSDEARGTEVDHRSPPVHLGYVPIWVMWGVGLLLLWPASGDSR
jgi:hypothetical protein